MYDGDRYMQVTLMYRVFFLQFFKICNSNIGGCSFIKVIYKISRFENI